MRVLITGINGLLGKDIGKVFVENKDYEVYGVGRAACLNSKINYRKVELTDEKSLRCILGEITPDLIIHCAAYTKLDDCEKNQEYAWLMNVKVTEQMAEYADKIVYISSDAVFSGSKGNYREDDVPDAINYYGFTKCQGEKVALCNKKALIIRSSIYGFNTNENQSIAEWGIRNLVFGRPINGFSDVIFNPLYSLQLANILLKLVEENMQGIFHLGAKVPVSKYDFFKLIAKELGANEKLVKPISVDTIDFTAKRTKNTSLNTEKINTILDEHNDLVTGIKQLVTDMRYYKRL